MQVQIKLITTTCGHNFVKRVVRIYGTGGETSVNVPATALRSLDFFLVRAAEALQVSVLCALITCALLL